MKARKILAMVAALALTAALAVGGTLAYLTSQTDTVTNTFTVGNVKIYLDEADVDHDTLETDNVTVNGVVRDRANAYQLYPGQTYSKDPTVTVARLSDAYGSAKSSENCWLFVKVENGLVKTIDSKDVNIEAASGDGYSTIAEQMAANGWSLVNGQTNVYAYSAIAKAGETKPVFAEFKIDGENVNNDTLAAFGGATIKVTAYAIQAEGFSSAADAWEKAPANWNA